MFLDKLSTGEFVVRNSYGSNVSIHRRAHMERDTELERALGDCTMKFRQQCECPQVSVEIREGVDTIKMEFEHAVVRDKLDGSVTILPVSREQAFA